MSLSSLIKTPEVVARVKPLRPRLPRNLGLPLIAEPRSRRYNVVGIAFDYLLRFELHRLVPDAIARTWWVADYAPGMLYEDRDGALGLRWITPLGPLPAPPPEAADAFERASEVTEQARRAVNAYRKLRRPTPARQAEVAAHALRLAKLDLVYRAWTVDIRFMEADSEDVEDLLSLLSIAPLQRLLHSGAMLLNPTFGESSDLLGGADADLITGDLLVDFKTVKEGKIRADHLDQLLGYYLLARRERRSDTAFPEVRRLALYFARYGHLWIVDASVWTDQPQFSETEEWFFQHAQEMSC